MRLTRTALLGVLSWVLVVGVGSTLVWAVISRAGQEVVASSPPPVVGSTSQASAEPTGSGPSGTGTSDPSTNPGSPVPQVPERRTWQGVGGVVVAECRGARISMVSAQADLGFLVEAKETGPERLRVEFEGREDESGSSTEVVAECQSGVPHFENATESDD